MSNTWSTNLTHEKFFFYLKWTVVFIPTSSNMICMRWIFIFAAPPFEDTKVIIFGVYWSSFAMNVGSRLILEIRLNSSFICANERQKLKGTMLEKWLHYSRYCKPFHEKILTWAASKRAGHRPIKSLTAGAMLTISCLRMEKVFAIFSLMAWWLSLFCTSLNSSSLSFSKLASVSPCGWGGK